MPSLDIHTAGRRSPSGVVRIWEEWFASGRAFAGLGRGAQRKAGKLTKVTDLGHMLLERFAIGSFLNPPAPVPLPCRYRRGERQQTLTTSQNNSVPFRRGPNLQHIHRLADRSDSLIRSVLILHLHQPVRPLERLGPDPTRRDSVVHVQHGEARLGDAGMGSVDVVGRDGVAQRGPVDRSVRLRVELLFRGVNRSIKLVPPARVTARSASIAGSCRVDGAD